MGKKAEYDSILSLFVKSTGAHMEPLKSLLCKESEAVGKVAEFLNATIEMLRKASVDIDEVETNYAVSKVETNS